MQVTGQMGLGQLEVKTTNGRGFTPEELAEGALNRILYVGDNVHPVIKDQAVAFKEQIRYVLLHYMKEAVKSDRTTLANNLKAAGHPELIKLLEI
jgi:hypothetical protein